MLGAQVYKRSDVVFIQNVLPFCLLTGVSLVAQSQASCSRVMQVPVAAIGLSVTHGDEGFGGVYPEILRSVQGCNFVLSAVPRARQQALFESGRADLLVPASRSPQRDEWGYFVPLVQARAVLISLQSERAPLKSLRELRDRRELRVALVRGFDFGEAYQDLLRDLRAQDRLVLEADVLGVARLLAAGMADVTVMAPSILIGAIAVDRRWNTLPDRLRIEPVDELPWGDSGVYISRSSVNEADRLALTTALERVARSGQVWRAFQRYYPPGSLAESIRPRRE